MTENTSQSLLIPPSSECVWGCGHSNFNAEHVIGRQFAKEMELPYPLVLRWAEYGLPQRKLEIVLRDRVCQRCNGRWMKKLDDHAREVMGPSIKSAQPVLVSSAARRIRLARWALKVGLLLSLWFHDQTVRDPKLIRATAPAHANSSDSLPYVPLQTFPSVRLDRAPQPDRWVWFGSAGSSIPEFFMIANGLSIRGQPGERAGYSAVFSLRSLVVLVIVSAPGHRDDVTAAMGTEDPAAFHPDRLAPVWPDADTLHWPPKRRLQTSDIEHLIGAPADWQSSGSAVFPTWRPGDVSTHSSTILRDG